MADLQATFRAGIERASCYWLAFFRNVSPDPAVWAQCGGHALRALIWSADSQQGAELAADLALALNRHVMSLGHWYEWESTLRHLIARANGTVDADRGWELKAALASLLFRLHRLDEAIGLLQENYEFSVARGDLRRQAGALIGLSEAYLNACLPQPALRCAEEAVALALAVEDPVREADGLINTARALLQLGDIAEAQHRLERALALTVAAGSAVWEAKARLFLGHAAAAAGNWALALARFREALPIVAGYHDEVGRATVLSNIGRALTELGCWDEAIGALEEALRVFVYHGNAPAEAVTRQRLAALQARRG